MPAKTNGQKKSGNGAKKSSLKMEQIEAYEQIVAEETKNTPAAKKAANSNNGDFTMAATHKELAQRVAKVDGMLDKHEFLKAAHASDQIVDELSPILPEFAKVALFQAKSLMTAAMNKMHTDGTRPPAAVFDKIWASLELAERLEPDNQEAKDAKTVTAAFLNNMMPPDAPKAVADADFDVLIVGAGAAGIGTAVMLCETFNLDSERVVTIERGASAGESFKRWPKEMRFISPSFNQQGWTNSFDLNSVVKSTSPAYSLHAEHPSGVEYASYLDAIVDHFQVMVQTHTEVLGIRSVGTDDLPLFSVNLKKNDGAKKTVTSRYIVWAAGEFQYPKGSESRQFSGSELCLHNSKVKSWAEVKGDEFIVIGGYESGCDAAYNLSKAGKQCRVLASTPCWSVKTKDPSAELAPYTAARLREVLAEDYTGPKPKLLTPLRVVRVERAGGDAGGFNVYGVWGKDEEASDAPNMRSKVQDNQDEQAGAPGQSIVLHTPNPPILCTGFVGSVAAAASHLFDFAPGGDTCPTDEKAWDASKAPTEKPKQQSYVEVLSSDDDEETKQFALELEAARMEAERKIKEQLEKEADDADGSKKESDNKKENKSNSTLQSIADAAGVSVAELRALNPELDQQYGEDGEEKKEKTKAAVPKGCLAGAPLLTPEDESTKTPGVFLVGPTVSQGKHSFCFVYKFRQRFAVVANAICKGIGKDTRQAVEECRKANMYMDDLACCEGTCGDVC